MPEAEHGCQLYLISPRPGRGLSRSACVRARRGSGCRLPTAHEIGGRKSSVGDGREAYADMRGSGLRVHSQRSCRTCCAARSGWSPSRAGDGDIAEARALLGREVQIGATCHDSRHFAMEAGEAGADYVAFGAFFPSDTKETTHRPDPEILTWWSTMFVLPCVAIGGITAENAKPLAEAGADFLAVSGAVWNHPDGEAAGVRAFAGFSGN